ncbi:tetraspanin-8-like [Acanthochromis polyacanthus]|uniref:Tetraspanin-8-like n=1 Tax=Acanthochromis polyacanthus TaxID=80966 RepID=A0A3Q1GXL7_9TELE|nr:tetraspanin-8-like [Acanthochromis polyacanthus]
MGKVNVCLKRTYLIVISLIAIIAVLLLGLTLFSHGHFHREEEIEEVLTALHVMYAVAVVILVLTIIGGFGAYKEKKWALIVFTVGMIMGSLYMMVSSVGGLASHQQVEKDMRKNLLAKLPLNNQSEHDLMDVQSEFQCCGLDQGYQDWNYYIPESCLCLEGSTNPCVAAPRNSSLFVDRAGEEIMIYSQPCLSYIMEYAMHILNAVLGILLGITLLWVLSVVLAIVILCRLDRKQETPTVVYSPEAKAGNYACLTEDCT